MKVLLIWLLGVCTIPALIALVWFIRRLTCDCRQWEAERGSLEVTETEAKAIGSYGVCRCGRMFAKWDRVVQLEYSPAPVRHTNARWSTMAIGLLSFMCLGAGSVLFIRGEYAAAAKITVIGMMGFLAARLDAALRRRA